MSLKLAYVLSSPLKQDTVVKLRPFAKGLDFDVYYLSSSPKEKILKKDVDLDLSLLDSYDIVSPVGAESLKYACGLTGILKYAGQLVNDKYIPIIDPTMLSIKPQYRVELQKSFDKINSIVTGAQPIKFEKDYAYIDSAEKFIPYLKQFQAADTIVCDIETTALSARKGSVIGVALSSRPHQGVFVASDVIEEFYEEVAELFRTKPTVLHNAKFDVQFLYKEMKFEFPLFEDTILMHYCLDETVGSHGLKELAMKFTDLGDYDKDLHEYKKEFCRKNKILLADFNYGMLPIEILAPYACKDADATFQLYNKFKPIIDKNKNFKNVYYNILKPATRALMYLEDTGGPIELSVLESIEADFRIDIEECMAEISMHPAIKIFEDTNKKTFNPNSTYHLRDVLFNIMKLKSTKKTTTGALSTDAEVLEELNNPLADAIHDLRKKVKLSTTYIKNIREGVDSDMRLRSSFNIIGTAAGRLSSSGVLNYQNLPRDKDSGIKKFFRASPGYKIVQADLGTAEVYVAAALANDKFLQRAFVEELDFHSYVAHGMFKLPCQIDEVKELYPEYRQNAKAITFGILYGAGPSKIAETANVSMEEAKRFIKLYFDQARDLKVWIESNIKFIKENHFTYSEFGRKRRLPEAGAESKGVAAHAERSGLNFLIQSVASDINLLGIIDTVDWVKSNNLQDEIRIFATVHDSTVAEVREDMLDKYVETLRSNLQRDRGVFIPGKPINVDIEVGPSWGELKGYK
jgi:DNA polymerase I-like protein with 3'-5' exonuclease and polymerase domains